MSVTLPDFSRARVLVTGDVMLDRYWTGATSRISPEAPVPVVHVTEHDDRPGGAGNVALNVAALGATVAVDGFVGSDAHADALTAFLRDRNVECRFERIAGLSTIVKLRVLSRHQQLIRLDFEDSFYRHDAHALLERYDTALHQVDVAVLSDYAKGTLACAPALIERARAADKPVLVDPKGVDFKRYRGATLLTPNASEFAAVVGRCDTDHDYETKGMRLIEELHLDALLITRGEHGMTLLQRGESALHLEAEAREVFDVTGAGDTVIGVLAAALAAGSPLADATRLANVAAGLSVAKLGAATVSVAELQQELAPTSLAATATITDRTTLIQQVARARAKGERIVMTNGCFDLLHVGHVTYLERARRYGDRLIVAVNDDDSVRKLKGNGRPINTLADRMAVLAGLRCVDWVVPFSEDTPERLICDVLPDVLVKGGDYRVEQIAGHRCVLDAGGAVHVVDLVPGASTTQTIARMKERT
jgi:D-beta-D-heptose 7-phosphate kinase/D-beta-D-heptose 1-phosphate adenosyltransferase